ncbi:MAG: sigma-70 family RNA polymerase sigma factor [Planctomycetota bacterium]
MTDEHTTLRLVTAAQAGDATARDDLFRRYLPRVAFMVAQRLGVRRNQLPAHAEDIAQEAIVRALAGLSQFEMRGPGAFAAWMATIVENCIRTHWRADHGVAKQLFWQRYGDLDLRESIFPGGGPSPSRMLATADTSAAIEAAMLELSSLHRRVLELKFIAGMSHAEVAQQIGRTEANSRKLLERALVNLRAELAKRSR